jgi:hypothetical protein
MPPEMFQAQIMDRLLKLKLEMVYRDMPVEQARQSFDKIKDEKPVSDKVPAPVKRKLRIVTKDK